VDSAEIVIVVDYEPRQTRLREKQRKPRQR
jgi:hypothetical protein